MRQEPGRGTVPVSLTAYRLRPRCAGCGRWVRSSGVTGWSHHPPRVWCHRCADRLDLERTEAARG